MVRSEFHELKPARNKCARRRGLRLSCCLRYVLFGINEFLVNGSTANLFTGVLTGIPKGKYDLTLVARPYAKSKGTYYYGDPISGNLRELALEIKNGGGYNALTDAQKAIIDTFAENKAE